MLRRASDYVCFVGDGSRERMERGTMDQKTALITGVTGQDGSYLAEHLLSLDYKVVGMSRRVSVATDERIRHLYSNKDFSVVQGDVTDPFSVYRIIDKYWPNEIYNLAAQSHVKVSFDEPRHTTEVTYLGCLNILEAVRQLRPHVSEWGQDLRFYQASSSEMFGQACSYFAYEEDRRESDTIPNLQVNPWIRPFQDEHTPMLPCSPYAIAKLAAHHLVRLYRESYGMFACSGTLYNHETVFGSMPLFVRFDDERGFDIRPICDIVRSLSPDNPIVDETNLVYQAGNPARTAHVWDHSGWTKVLYASGYPHSPHTDYKNPLVVNARRSAIASTGSHIFFMADNTERAADSLVIGDRVALVKWPEQSVECDDVSDLEAEMLGMMVADGWIDDSGRHGKFTKQDVEIRDHFNLLWYENGGTTSYNPSVSEWSGKEVGQLVLNGNSRWLLSVDMYNTERNVFGHRTKKVPRKILNAPIQSQLIFLRAYNRCDGLKKHPVQHEFKNFSSNSATLALGLLYLLHRTTGQTYNITVEYSEQHGKPQTYYSINLLSPKPSGEQKAAIVRELLSAGYSIRAIARETGISRKFTQQVSRGHTGYPAYRVPPDEVKKIISLPTYDGWFYDLETESGSFHCGVGQGHVHNSPRRGQEFVTRKITKYVASYVADKSIGPLLLGNLSAKRDWGHAQDYVSAMHLMLQQDNPDDFVIATGDTHSVQEFLDEAFRLIGEKPYYTIDPSLYRPCEVPYLRGDSAKAKRKLGWKPNVTFSQLVRDMVFMDIAALHGEDFATKVIRD